MSSLKPGRKVDASTLGQEQAQNSKSRGSIVRREPVTSIHPLIRTHPVGLSTSGLLCAHADSTGRLLARKQFT